MDSDLVILFTFDKKSIRGLSLEVVSNAHAGIENKNLYIGFTLIEKTGDVYLAGKLKENNESKSLNKS